MFCKQTQNNVDALLRLKSNENLCVHAIKQVMDQQDHDNGRLQSNLNQLEN